MKIKEVIAALEHFAPLPLQEGFDNAGLQVGLTEAVDVSGALLCLDVTEAVVDEAIALGCNLIVSHHPVIFHKLRRISDEDYVQRTVMKAIKNDITIVSMHTNMDEAEGGVNHKMAEKMGLGKLRFFGKQKVGCGCASWALAKVGCGCAGAGASCVGAVSTAGASSWNSPAASAAAISSSVAERPLMASKKSNQSALVITISLKIHRMTLFYHK